MKLEDIAKLLDEKLNPIREDIEEMKAQMATKDDLTAAKEELKAEIKQSRNFLDKTVMENKKGVGRIEEHLDLPPLQ